MATIASVDIALTASSVQLRQELEQANRATQQYARRARNSYSRLNTTLSGLTRTFGIFVAGLGAQQILSSTDNLLKLSQATGLTFEEFQRLSFAFEQAGVENTRFARGLTVLSQRIVDLGEESSLAVDSFSRLNLNFQDLNRLSQQEQLFLILDRMREIENATERAAVAADIFGSRLAVQLGPILNTTNDALVRLGDSIRVIDQGDAETIEEFNDSLQNLGRSLIRLATQFSPILSATASFVDQIARLIDSIGGALVVALNTLALVFARRVVVGIRSAVVASAAFVSQQAALNVAVARGSAMMVGYGASLSLVNRLTSAATIGLTNLGLGFRAATIAVGFFRAALIGVGVVLRTIFAPINLIIAAVVVLANVFGDELVSAFRAAVNFIVAQLNRLLSGLDAFLQYFGSDGIQFRFEEWEEATRGVNEELQELNLNLGEFPEIVADATQEVSAFQQTLEDATDVATRMSEFGARVFDNMADALTDFITTGMISIRNFAQFVIREFIRIQVRSALANSFLSFGIPGRQFGGPVAAGQPYVVGEAGPELFVPNQSGNIIPNSAVGQRGENVTYNINAVDARSFRQLVAQDPSFIYQVTERGRRERPGVR